MALKSGLAGQVGFVSEVSYGIPLTVTRFPRFVSESMKLTIERIESASILAGRNVLDSSQWFPGRVSAGGDIALELTDRGQGLLWTHMLGGAGISGSGTYTQTYTPGDLSGLSFTTQVGRPGMNGTVVPMTYPGCKVASWELACSEGEIATLGLTIMAKAEYRYLVVTDGVLNSTTTLTSATGGFSIADIGSPISGTGIPALTTIAAVASTTSITLSAAATATASSVSVTIGQALATFADTASVVPFRYVQGIATLAGSAVKVNSATVAADNALTERRFLGQYTTEDPQGADLRAYTGTLVAEWTDRTLYERYVQGTETALVLTFTAGTKTLTITTNVRYDGETPNVSGRGLLELTLPFKCIGTTDAAAITVQTINTDAAA